MGGGRDSIERSGTGVMCCRKTPERWWASYEREHWPKSPAGTSQPAPSRNYGLQCKERETDRRRGGWGGRQGRTGQCSSRRWSGRQVRVRGRRDLLREKGWACWPRARRGRCGGRLQQFTAAVSPLDLNLNDESERGISLLDWKRIKRRRRKSYLRPFLSRICCRLSLLGFARHIKGDQRT